MLYSTHRGGMYRDFQYWGLFLMDDFGNAVPMDSNLIQQALASNKNKA